MKKIIHFCVCCIVFVSTLQTVSAQRSVFMVHGTKGNTNTMAPMGNFLSQSRSQFAQQPLQGYDSNNGIQTFSASFNSLNSNASFNATNYAICYDAGGVMMHQRDQQGGASGNQAVNGYILLGTPLNGSRFNNPARIPQFQDFIVNGIEQVTAGPIATTVAALGISLGSDLAAKALEKVGIPTFTISDFINVLVPLFGLPNTGTLSGADIADGGTFVNALGAASPTSTPKIVIFGSEAGPTFWRALGTAIKSDFNETSFQSESGENDMVLAVDIVAALYYGAAIAYGVATVVSIIRIFWGDFSAISGAISNGLKIKKWLGGAMWLDFKANREWNVLIGSQVDEFQVCYTEETVHCTEEEMARMRDPSACVTSVTHCSTSAVIGENDGVLSASTATGFMNQSMIDARPPRRAENCNHEELVRGQRGASEVLNEIANNSPNNPFFTQ